MKIRHIILSCVCGALVCGTASCDGMLDQYPHNGVSSGNLTETDSELLLTGLYLIVQNKPTNNGYAAFDILGGDICRKGATLMTPQLLVTGLMTPESGFISGQWNGYYTGLYQVNSLLKSLNGMAATDKRNEMIGVASFFRGLIYYNLATRWRNCPILEVPTTNDVASSPEADVWAFVERNLQTAIDYAPDFTSKNYVSRQAAQALMARALLAQGKTTEAARMAETVIGSGFFALDGFDKIFRGQANTEEIFTFANLTTEASVNLSGAFYYSRASAVGGSYQYAPTDEVMEMYLSGDLRAPYSIDRQDVNDVINKFPGGEASPDPLCIVRLGEMYLISAEAQGRTDGIGRLNELRRFRGLDDVAPASDEAFIDAVLDERRHELLAENFRWYDLVRLGRFEKTLGVDRKYSVMPIPSQEMNRNRLLEQHPYWSGAEVE